MSQGYGKPNTGSGGDRIKGGFNKVNTSLDAVHTNNEGSSAPATTAEGILWMDSTDTTDFTPKMYENSTWITLDMKATLKANKDFANYQALNFVAENVGTTPGPEATTVGRMVFNTGTGDLLVDNHDVSGDYDKLIAAPEATGILFFYEIGIENWQVDDTNPPTEATKGTTPTVKGYLFDATNEKLTLKWTVPTNWIGDSDGTLDLYWLLNQAETSGDDIDNSMDWIKMTPGSGTASQTSTSATASTDIGSGTGDGTLHRSQITIDHDDATNGFTAGDVLVFEVSRPNLTEVGGCILIQAGVSYYRDDL